MVAFTALAVEPAAILASTWSYNATVLAADHRRPAALRCEVAITGAAVSDRGTAAGGRTWPDTVPVPAPGAVPGETTDAQVPDACRETCCGRGGSLPRATAAAPGPSRDPALTAMLL